MNRRTFLKSIGFLSLFPLFSWIKPKKLPTVGEGRLYYSFDLGPQHIYFSSPITPDNYESNGRWVKIA